MLCPKNLININLKRNRQVHLYLALDDTKINSWVFAIFFTTELVSPTRYPIRNISRLVQMEPGPNSKGPHPPN